MGPQQRIGWIFFIQALAGGSIFARIPDIQTGLGLSESVLGLALVAASAGGLAANLIGGRMVDRLGTRVFLLWAIPFLAVINAVVGTVQSVPMLFAVLIVSGALFSFSNLAMNVEADRIEVATGSRIMNRCHGLWSFGMLAAAAIGVGARAIPLSTQAHLWGLVPVLVPLAVAFTWPVIPAKRSDKGTGRTRGIALPNWQTVVIVSFGLSAGVAQMAAQNWSVIYMRDTFVAPDWVDTLTLPAYLLAMAVGRVLADGWIARFGAKPVAYALSTLAVLGAVLAAGSPFVLPVILAFGLLGVGSAVHFPLMITAAARTDADSSATAVSAAILLSGAAMMVTPGIMGWVAEVWGLRTAFAILVGPFLLSLVLVRRVVH